MNLNNLYQSNYNIKDSVKDQHNFIKKIPHSEKKVIKDLMQNIYKLRNQQQQKEKIQDKMYIIIVSITIMLLVLTFLLHWFD